MNVVDSSGWIEFFLASANGLHFKPVIEDTRHLLVPVIALYEVHKRLSRNLPADIVASCLDVMRLGRVLELTDARAIAASITATAHNLALADAAMYSMAQEHDASLWTQDIDYQGLPGVNYFAKCR
jgi:predicted nucleic acid-binding protein